MRYWWVNQNQTYRQELGGGYLWSPKRNANDVRNPFYEFMREVAPGDIIFSFVDTRIFAIGVAESYCYESPKPEEFGGAGRNWEAIGWRVRVRFTNIVNRIRPKDHIGFLRPLLPSPYSPLQLNGNGIQSVYLTYLPEALAERAHCAHRPRGCSPPAKRGARRQQPDCVQCRYRGLGAPHRIRDG
jgi:putative restriction endonuclease